MGNQKFTISKTRNQHIIHEMHEREQPKRRVHLQPEKEEEEEEEEEEEGDRQKMALQTGGKTELFTCSKSLLFLSHHIHYRAQEGKDP